MLEFFTISLVILLAAISPGPDFVLVTRNALRYSQGIGVMTACGIACSLLLHASYCILGFAIIIAKSLLLFNIIKYIGASYLIYLGIKGLLEKATTAQISATKTPTNISAMQAFMQGVLCNALNPKAIFFFLALFTLLIRPSMPIIVQVGYAVEISLIHLIWFSMVAFFFAHSRIKLFLGNCLHYITKTFGAVLILFGLKIATLTR